MLDKVVRKLQALEQAVSGGELYANIYEAQSLSAIDLSETAPAFAMPAMARLRRLCEEVTGVLNEGHIEQQSELARVRTELLKCTQCTRSVCCVLRPGETLHADLLGGEEELLSELEMTAQQARLMEVQLQAQLTKLYRDLRGLADGKVLVLQSVRRLGDSYCASMTELGTSSGVLAAGQKVALASAPHLPPLLQHRLLCTSEEEALLHTLRTIWAQLVLNSGAHAQLAERQLSESVAQRGQGSYFYIKVGCTLVLLFWAFSECFQNETMGRKIWDDQTFSIFMCLGDLLLLLIMWGVSIQVWRACGIDYARLLQLHETDLNLHEIPESAVYASSANLCLFFLLAFVLFNKAVRGGYFSTTSSLTIAHAIPAAFAVFCAVRVVQPYRSRRVWLGMLGRVLLAPMYPVSFRDGYIGDLLTSLVRVTVPLCFSVTYVGVTVYAWLTNHLSLTVTRSDAWWSHSRYHDLLLVPLLTLLPLWLRLLQCLRRSVESGKRWPHMGNALKYTSAIIVIAFGTYQPRVRSNPLWVAAFVLATLFQFVWDLTQDWGMVQVRPPAVVSSGPSGLWGVEYILGCTVEFRQTRLLGPAPLYVAVILGNLLLRFAWTLTLLPAAPLDDALPSLYASFVTHLGPLLASAEIIRRMVWGFFRLEWEQLQQIGTPKKSNMGVGVDMGMGTGMGMGADVEMDLRRMDMSSSVEMHRRDTGGVYSPVGMGGEVDVGGNGGGGGGGDGDGAWTETDWTVGLPRYVRGSVASLGRLSGGSYANKLRLLEALLFGAAVVASVLHAAAPAFA